MEMHSQTTLKFSKNPSSGSRVVPFVLYPPKIGRIVDVARSVRASEFVA